MSRLLCFSNLEKRHKAASPSILSQRVQKVCLVTFLNKTSFSHYAFCLSLYSYQKYLRCPYKHYCRCAHGKDELEEWIQYTAKQKHEKQGQSWRQQVCDELVNRLKIDGDLASNDVVCAVHVVD